MTLTMQDLAAFLSTPEAQALTTQSEKIAAAKQWKKALDDALLPDAVLYDPVVHLEMLREERKQWGQAWRQWSTDEQKRVRQQRIETLDRDIADVEKIINSAE